MKQTPEIPSDTAEPVDAKPRGPGRPKGKRNKTTLLKEREKKEGVKIRTARGVKSPPEFKHRISGGAVKDTYAAANRALQYKIDMWNWECAMIKTHNEEHGTSVPLPPKPGHPFDAPSSAPSFGDDECVAFFSLLAFIPSQFGMESRPSEEATIGAAKALSKVLSHYPAMDSKMVDIAMFALAGSQWAMPWMLEIRAKKNGTWVHDRARFQAMGLVSSDNQQRQGDGDGADA